MPTDFEMITFTKDLGRSWKFETKPYTYSYSNHQHLQKKQDSDYLAPTPIEVDCNATSAVDKLNQYNRGGEITTVSAASRYGVFRAGAWYEYTTTHRYQIKTNPTHLGGFTESGGCKVPRVLQDQFDSTLHRVPIGGHPQVDNYCGREERNLHDGSESAR